MSDEVIRLEGIRKQFGSFVAVHEADFGIKRGEFFALLGPSGCGKTTLLRMIAGFEDPTAGRVLLDGQDQAGVPPYRRQVNTVFQQYALFPHMSVFDNVAFGLRSNRVPEADVKRRANEMLETVRLSDYGKRRPAQLSGGQQQRVALARALVNLPSALLLDEPLAALDLKLRQAMQIELKRIQREVGITFVFVTHDQEEALTMSDRIAVMSQGRVEQIGTPQEIYNAPSSVFVAGFIGSANLLPGTAVAREGNATVIELTMGTRVRAEGQHIEIGAPASVMLRPELLNPVMTDPGSGGLSATVTDVIFQGADIRLISDLADGTEVVSTVETDADLPMLRPGDNIWLTWDQRSPYALSGHPAFAGATNTDVDEVQAALDGHTDLKHKLKELDPRAVLKGSTTRRNVLIGAGAAVVAAVAAGIGVAASGGDKKSTTPSGTVPTTEAAGDTTSVVPTTSAGPAVTAAGGEPGSTVTVLNWPMYIENDDASTSPMLTSFTQSTGIKVDYRPEIDSNDGFWTKYQPFLAKGEGIGADIVVLTSWLAARFIEQGFAQPWDTSAFPNKANVTSARSNPSWDPGRAHSIPWTVGQTGIAYFPDKVGGKIESISDLLSPSLKNRVSVLDEWRDTLGLFMLDLGLDPSNPDLAGARKAIEVIKKARDAGQFRKIAGNSYLDDLQTGEVWAAIAWSGDIASLKKDVPGIEFVLPPKGAMSFTDNALIPIGAKNPRGAALLLNHLYDPTVAGPFYEAINYVPSVRGAAEYMSSTGRANPFVNPPQGAKLYEFDVVPEDVESELAALFVEATQL
jgi:spermidine/putrescine transport system ATP-binding protein